MDATIAAVDYEAPNESGAKPLAMETAPNGGCVSDERVYHLTRR
jgi:hypothetical protein